MVVFIMMLLVSSESALQRGLSRATEDRPDDVEGFQVHFVYAMPSDGLDRSLDTNGGGDASWPPNLQGQVPALYANNTEEQ